MPFKTLMLIECTGTVAQVLTGATEGHGVVRDKPVAYLLFYTLINAHLSRRGNTRV
jgi:hypothetical protein